MRLDEDEIKYIKAHTAEIDTLIDHFNAAKTQRIVHSRVWKIIEFVFILGRRYEREET